MHLCVITGTHAPETSGPATYLSHLLPALIERGHTLEVVTYTDTPHSGPDNNFSYPVYRVSRRQPVLLRLLAMTYRVIRAARRADVIFVSDYGLPAALARPLVHKPIVLKSVSDFAWEFATRKGWLAPGTTIDEFQQARHPTKVRFLQRLQRSYVRAARTIIAPSEYSASLVKGWGIPAERVRVVYNALERDAFAALPDKAAVRAELGFEAQPLLIAAGRLVAWKCFDRIIAAMPTIRAAVPTAHLVVIGDGPEREKLARAAAAAGEMVVFTGMLPPAALHRYLRAADVYVQFSTYEGLPHTALEAMAANTPVILSNVGGNVEVVTPGESGLLVEPGDIAAFAHAVVRVLSNPNFARMLASNAARALERFSWDRLVEQTETILREAAA